MRPILILISSVLALVSPVIYARSILKGHTKPHRTTRLVILIITLFSTLALWSQGNTVAIWLSVVSFIQAVFIFGLSIKHGMGGWAKSDILCLAVALVGIVLWKITANPTLGLYFAIGADFVGMLPAIVKTYRLPDTEIASFYVIDTIAGLLSLLAVHSTSLADTAYPLYIVLINLLMAILIIRNHD